MKIQRNWFVHLSITLFSMGICYALASGFSQIAQQYEFLIRACFIIFIFAAFACLYLCGNLFERLQRNNRLSQNNIQKIECIAVILAFSLGLIVRIICVIQLPVKPQSDFELYYIFAEALSKGELGPQSYIALFPHVFGYPWFLSIIFRIFGVSLNIAIGFNIMLSMATCLIVWRIAKQLGGVLSGIIALFVTVFWPSQIIYGNTLGGEFLFTFLLTLCIWIFLAQFNVLNTSSAKTIRMLILLGVILAVADIVRPMARIFLIAIVITLLSCKSFISVEKREYLARFYFQRLEKSVNYSMQLSNCKFLGQCIYRSQYRQ